MSAILPRTYSVPWFKSFSPTSSQLRTYNTSFKILNIMHTYKSFNFCNNNKYFTYVIGILVIVDAATGVEVVGSVWHSGVLFVVRLGCAASCSSKGCCRTRHVVEHHVSVNPLHLQKFSTWIKKISYKHFCRLLNL
jgi:hypothetical protein